MLSRCPISGMHQPTRPFLRFSPSSLLPFVPPSLPPLSLGSRGGREGGGDPTRQCQVLVLTCPCENGAPITATEWTDFFRAKFTCVPRKRERLLLRDMMGSAGRCQIRGCYVRLAALSKRRRRQLRLPTRARAAPRSPVTSQPPGPSPTPPSFPSGHMIQLPACGPAQCRLWIKALVHTYCPRHTHTHPAPHGSIQRAQKVRLAGAPRSQGDLSRCGQTGSPPAQLRGGW